MLARRQFTLERLRKISAPTPLLEMAENNVKAAEKKLWELMELGTSGEDLPPIFDILGREALLARCKALAKQVLEPFRMLHELVKEALDNALAEAGVEIPEEASFEDEDTIFEKVSPVLYSIMEELYAVEAEIAEKLLLQKWSEVKQALQF